MPPKPAADQSRGILDHLLEGCQIISPDWRYVYVDDAVVRHSRKERDDLLGHRMMDVFPGIEQTIHTQLQRLRALRAIDRAILGSGDLDLAFRTILEEARAQLGADIVNLKLFNPATHLLETAAAVGHRSPMVEALALRLGEGVAGTAALEGRTVAVPTGVTRTCAGSKVAALYAGPVVV